MAMIAAFLWNKSSNGSISTMIIDERSMQYLSPPKIHHMPQAYFRFRLAAFKLIKEFFMQIKRLHKLHKKPVIIEFRIVFHAYDIPYLLPAKESKFVYTNFMVMVKLLKKTLRNLQIKPQLRKRLSGRELQQFKKGLRSLHLVSRKRHTGFEYHLWTVALHATSTNYKDKLITVREKLLRAMWNEEI